MSPRVAACRGQQSVFRCSVEGEHHEKAVELLKAAPASVKLVVRWVMMAIMVMIMMIMMILQGTVTYRNRQGDHEDPRE